MLVRSLAFSIFLVRPQSATTSVPLQNFCSTQTLRCPRTFSTTITPTTIESAKFHPIILNTLEKLQITSLFPVQKKTFSPIIEGKDVIVKALTGSGKTFAFVLPIVQRLLKENITPKSYSPPVLVLAPTRELAIQIGAQFNHFAPSISCHAIYGGVSYIPQKHHLRRGLHVVVGTPGRILDLIKSQALNLDQTRYYVLDEVDRMLEIGLQETVDAILASVTRNEVQTLFFSATIPPWIQKYQRDYLREPLTIDLIGESPKVPSNVKHVAVINRGRGYTTLIQNAINFYNSQRTIVFTSTKIEAFELTGTLNSAGIPANQVHGDVAQNQRELALRSFRSGECSVLVATDVAARGLDIPEVDLVIQCSMPQTPEDYVHRSGRAGRAGRAGTAVLVFEPRDMGAVKRLASQIGIEFEFKFEFQADWKSLLNSRLQKLEEVPPIFHELADTMKDRIQDIAPQLLALVCGYSAQSYQSLLDGTSGRITLEVSSDGPVTQSKIEAYVRGLGVEFPEFSRCVYAGRQCLMDFPANLGFQLLNGPPGSMKFQIAQTAPFADQREDASEMWREKKEAFRRGNFGGNARRGFGRSREDFSQRSRGSFSSRDDFSSRSRSREDFSSRPREDFGSKLKEGFSERRNKSGGEELFQKFGSRTNFSDRSNSFKE